MKKLLFLSGPITFLLFVILFESSSAFAAGHRGFYMGIGYEQLFMVSPDYQLNSAGSNTSRVNFGPGYGGDAVVGYNFYKTRWGVQVPFEFSRIKLNKVEWINDIAAALEGIYRIAEWDSGVDFHLVGGIGFSYLSEGRINDNTKSTGITVGVGPGVTYIFSKTEKVTGGVTAELPIRYQRYVGTHLSNNGTSVIAFPLRLSVQVGF